jgi:hypothetical protein
MRYEELQESLANQIDFEFGAPWRVSKKSTVCAIPILRKAASCQRGYVVAEEVKDRLKFSDTGRINGVEVKNSSGKPVFLRGGSAFAGIETQSRTATFGRILMPEAAEILETVCIHASHYIQPEADFRVEEVVPESVRRAALERNQRKTWNAVEARSEAMSCLAFCIDQNIIARTTRLVRPLDYSRDNLLALKRTLGASKSFQKTMDDILEKIPAELNKQVGLVLVGSSGVEGFEMFDHEDSWKAFSKSIVRSYDETLLKEEKRASAFRMNKQKLTTHIIEFLKKAQVQKKQVYSNDISKTFLLQGKEIAGECTEIKDNVIHVVLSKKPEETP